MVMDEGFNRTEVIEFLQRNEYTRVTFYKVNGELREMLCTLNQAQLERLALSEEGLNPSTVYSANLEDRDPNQVRVWDVEKKAWRSFLLTNLVTIEGVNL